MAIRILNKSIDLAYDLFPKVYNENRGRRPYHFAFIFKGNQLISFGVNGYSPASKILNLGNRFRIKKYQTHRYPHAETDAISKVWGKMLLDNSCSMTIIRVNAAGKLQNSKPCKDCQIILDSIGIKKIWWSTNNMEITNGQRSFEVIDKEIVNEKRIWIE